MSRDNPQCLLNSIKINHILVLKSTLTSRTYGKTVTKQTCTALTYWSCKKYVHRNYASIKRLLNVYLYLNKITLLSFNTQNKFKLFLKSGRNFDSERFNMVSTALSVS